MKCEQETKRLEVETNRAIYEIEFGQVQIEITGRCNMRCEHCRASLEKQTDMPVDQIAKIIQFARRYSPDYKEVVVSGGEPTLHKDFFNVLRIVRENGGKSVSLTTNGSLLTEEHLDFIESLEFEKFRVSVSLDSLDPEEHDRFRRYPSAFEKAIRAIQLVLSNSTNGITLSVRTTIHPHQIADIDEIVRFVFNIGCKRISISGIHPSGRAAQRPEFWMSKEQKRKFLEKIYELKEIYWSKGFNVHTNDPLQHLISNRTDIGKDESEIVFDGCAAAACTFNVSANGNMTPCALMNLPMFNIFNMSIDEIAEAYKKSEIVKNMLDMNLKGKCGHCEKKYQCGGCRARALTRNGDYLAEDPDCWI